HELGVVVAPPGAGKTVIACAAIAHHQRPTLVLVDRRPLLEQWQDRLQEYLGLKEDQIGLIGGGKKRPTGIVDVAMIQTVARMDRPRELFDQYGLVVVDECHHLPAVSFEACVREASTRRWLGLTATPYRRDGLEGIITLYCGPTRHEIKPGEMADAELIHREVIVRPTSFALAEDELAIQAIFSALVEDTQRTNLICDDVATAVSVGRNCLVLTQRTSHIESITQRLADLGCIPHVLRGGLGKKARNTVIDQISSARSGDGMVVVATGSYLGEGFDWPTLETLFLAFPIAFKGRVVQYVGRLLRTHADKHHVELYDYLDEGVPVLARMHAKRLPVYRTLGFDKPTIRRTDSPDDPF
ncbi:MAG: DEAD/DEAH box helicase, partial [bacterium]|nr:DEAD/DEAH box helicase [bacterium]